MRFGSDELHHELKKAYETGDIDYAGTLLFEPVVKTGRMLLARYSEHFKMFNHQDREDAIQNALLYMLDHLRDLACPQNEGTPNFTYYAKFVMSGLQKQRYKIIRNNEAISLDAPLPGGDDDKERTIGDVVPSGKASPDRTAQLRDDLQRALTNLFSLDNAPETIVSVTYVILYNTLGGKPASMTEYAHSLNGRKVSSVVDEIEDILRDIGQDLRCLDKLRKRLNAIAGEPAFENVTAAWLANRKNAMLTGLRRQFDPED